MFRSEQSKRFPQLGQVTLQFFSYISAPQRSQRKMRFLSEDSSASLEAGWMSEGAGSVMGPVDGAEEGKAESGKALGSQSFHLGEDGFSISFELANIHAPTGIWVCA